VEPVAITSDDVSNKDSFLPEDNTIIRRYLRMNSFLELLYCQFVQIRADAFEDAAEGAYYSGETVLAPELLSRLGLASSASREQIVRSARERTLITCWYEGNRESFGMWKAYGRLRESVAVESTVGELRKILAKGVGGAGDVRIERVRYRRLTGSVSDFATLFLHKREEYEYESEIRSVQSFPYRVGSRVHNTALTLQELNSFLRRVIVAPGSRRMFLDAIRGIVNATFNIARLRFEGAIEQSNLDSDLVIQNP
jgi:hypothetical protein